MHLEAGDPEPQKERLARRSKGREPGKNRRNLDHSTARAKAETTTPSQGTSTMPVTPAEVEAGNRKETAMAGAQIGTHRSIRSPELGPEVAE